MEGVQRRGKTKSAKRDQSLGLHTSQVAQQTEASPGFSTVKRLGVFLLSLERVTGLPPALHSPVAIYTLGWREVL